MHACIFGLLLRFEGQFEGRGLFRRPENLHFSLWRTSQVGSHRLRQETLLERIFNNQRSPLAMTLRAFLFLVGKFVSPRGESSPIFPFPVFTIRHNLRLPRHSNSCRLLAQYISDSSC